jgi:hypothetical protein
MCPLSPVHFPSTLDHAEAAREFIKMGRFDDAWEELELLEPRVRCGPSILALRVDILLGKGMTDFARSVAEGAVKLYPESGSCHYALALVEANSGRLVAAREALVDAFIADPDLRPAALRDARFSDFWRQLGV